VRSPLLVGERDWFIEGDEDGFSVSGPWGTIGDLRTSLAGQHQVENAALAVATLMTIPNIGREIDARAIREGLVRARHPGRFERVVVDDSTTIIIDGAHTPIAAVALGAALAHHVPDERAVFIVGMLKDKHPAPFLTPLTARAAGWVAVEPDSPRAMPGRMLVDALVALGQPVESSTTVAAGIDMARASGARLIVVTGSLSTVADARMHLGLATSDASPD
jgi:dihydrofolate synthase / folylpolyglutamate synthase